MGGAIDFSTRDATTFASKLSATTRGISGGVDFRVTDGIAIGVGGGFGSVSTEIGGEAATMGANTSMVAAYGSAKIFGSGFIDIVVGRGWLDYKTLRDIDGGNAFAVGRRDGNIYIGAVAIGLQSQTGPINWSIYGNVDYIGAELDGYSESGLNDRDLLRFSGIDDEWLSAGLGFRLQRDIKTTYGSLMPRLGGEGGYQSNQSGNQFVDYVDFGDQRVRAISMRQDSRSYRRGFVGVAWALDEGLNLDAEFNLSQQSGFESTGFRLQVSRSF
jgi:hypothetical protein